MDSYFEAGLLQQTTMMQQSTIEKLVPSFSDIFVSDLDGVKTDLKVINESPTVSLKEEGVMLTGHGFMEFKNTLNHDLTIVQMNYTFTSLLQPTIDPDFKLKGSLDNFKMKLDTFTPFFYLEDYEEITMNNMDVMA